MACRGLSGDGDLGNPRGRFQAQARFTAIAIDDVERASRQHLGNQFQQGQSADGRPLSGLEHHAIAHANGGSQPPGGQRSASRAWAVAAGALSVNAEVVACQAHRMQGAAAGLPHRPDTDLQAR
jgi:hypothetical protein